MGHELPGMASVAWASTTPFTQHTQTHIFSTPRNDSPAAISLLLLLAGDIESNPGPTNKYICPTCSKPITSNRKTQGSVFCNSCRSWTHYTCTTLESKKDYTNNWTCSSCSLPTPPPPPPNPPSSHTPTPSPQPPSTPHSPTTTSPRPIPAHPSMPNPLNPQPSPPSSPPSSPPPSPNPHAAAPVNRTHNINILQLNIDGISTKKQELAHFMMQHNIHIAILQETKLRRSQKTPSFHYFTTIRKDRADGNGGGLITLVHRSINFSNVSAHIQSLLPPHDTTTEIQAIQVRTGNNSYTTIVNTYIPPQNSPTIPNNYNPQLQNIATTHNLILGGDFNAKTSAWYIDNPDTDRGLSLQNQTNNLSILNNIHQHTHTPHQANHLPSSPDITFCSPNLAPTTSWRVVRSLGSDHLPIIITTKTRSPPAGHRHTYTNYKRANWEAFTAETEQHFETFNNAQITNINTAIKDFNTIIQNADKHHIPKGNRKIHNPNFTPEIQGLIRQRDTLKHTSPLPHTQNITQQIQALNTQITNKIQEQKTQNWNRFVSTLDHKTNTSKLYKTLNSITLSNSNATNSHAAITTPNNIPSNKQQANIFINQFSHVSHLTPHPNDRKVMRRKRTFPTDPDFAPFTYHQTKHIIHNLKHSPASGPDGISNIHLRHLGPHGIQALTNIANHSYSHNTIPNIWKHGKIITFPKPNKDPTLPSSHRPITLLCTSSKVLERLILNNISPHIPLAPSQHGFRPLHSTNTLLTELTQRTFDGINSARPPHRTLLVTLDISKAFDAIPRHNLTDKIYNTTMHNNTKRWLANYLAGRNAHVSFAGQSSKTKNIKNGVPQGSVLSPTLFNLYMHDIPAPQTPQIHITSYADDITLTCSHQSADQATQLLQPYLDTLQTWFNTNRLKIAPTKSTVTLLTSWTAEHRYIPHLTINNTPIPHTHTPKILGVTYDTSMSFKQHITNIKNKCTPRLNALRSLTSTTFGHNKESTTTVYKQYIRSVIDYASPAWAPNLTATHHNTLQTLQNKALKIITGCTSTTPTDHLHHETKVLKVKDHLDMRGTQIIAAASTNPQHPLHNLTHHPPKPRSIKTTPSTRYQTQILSSLPPCPPQTDQKKHIHTQITHRSIHSLKDNTLLHARPPDIHPSESSLPREDRVHLARLRCGHHPALLSYQKRLDGTIGDACPDCNTAPHTIKHIMEDCNTHNHRRQQHNIHSMKDLWENPVRAVAFLRSLGLFGQAA